MKINVKCFYFDQKKDWDDWSGWNKRCSDKWENIVSEILLSKVLENEETDKPTWKRIGMGMFGAIKIDFLQTIVWNVNDYFYQKVANNAN